MAGRFSDAERRRILRAWLRSGLSSHDFAAARGVSHATLYKWKRELGATGSLSRRRFVEIVPTPSAGFDEGASGAHTDSGLELRVGRGHRLGIARDFDPETLRRVVETLTGELAR